MPSTAWLIRNSRDLVWCLCPGVWFQGAVPTDKTTSACNVDLYRYRYRHTTNQRNNGCDAGNATTSLESPEACLTRDTRLREWLWHQSHVRGEHFVKWIYGSGRAFVFPTKAWWVWCFVRCCSLRIKQVRGQNENMNLQVMMKWDILLAMREGEKSSDFQYVRLYCCHRCSLHASVALGLNMSCLSELICDRVKQPIVHTRGSQKLEYATNYINSAGAPKSRGSLSPAVSSACLCWD